MCLINYRPNDWGICVPLNAQAHKTWSKSFGMRKNSLAYSNNRFYREIKKNVFNLSKPNGKYTYHKVWHSKILYFDHMEFVCFVGISEKKGKFCLMQH